MATEIMETVFLRGGEQVRLVWEEGNWRIVKYLPGRPGLQGVVFSRSDRWWSVQHRRAYGSGAPDWYTVAGANTLKAARRVLAERQEAANGQ